VELFVFKDAENVLLEFFLLQLKETSSLRWDNCQLIRVSQLLWCTLGSVVFCR